MKELRNRFYVSGKVTQINFLEIYLVALSKNGSDRFRGPFMATRAG